MKFALEIIFGPLVCAGVVFALVGCNPHPLTNAQYAAKRDSSPVAMVGLVSVNEVCVKGVAYLASTAGMITVERTKTGAVATCN